MFYKILNKYSSDYSVLNNAAGTILRANISGLKINQVKIGMGGNIIFENNQAIIQLLKREFAHLNYFVEVGTTIAIHGHFNVIQDRKTHIGVRELTSIHFTINDEDGYYEHLGELNGSNLTNAAGYAGLNENLKKKRLS